MTSPLPHAIERYRVARLRTQVGPVLPFVMLGVAGLQLVSATAYAVGLTPTQSLVSAAILAASAIVIAVLAAAIRFAARRDQVELAGVACILASTILSAGPSLASWHNDLSILIAMPYAVLISVGGTLFWLTLRHYALGQVGIFAPPVILLVVTSPTPVEVSFSVQIAGIALATSFGMYALFRRTNLRAFGLAAELEQRATYDGLTGVFNRATWLARARARLADAARRGQPVACLYLDLDGFKHVNDSLGHSAGDGLLGEVAEALKRCAGDDSLVGRMGGDEFVILVPDATRREADALADRIVSAIRAVRLEPGASAASVGVAAWDAGDTLDDLVQRADFAMLAVKERNRLVAGPEVAGAVRQPEPTTATA